MCSLRGTHCIFPSLSVCYAASQSLQLANKQEAQMAYRNSFLCWFPPVLFFRPYHQTVLSRVVLGSADCPYLCRRLALRYFPLCLSNSRYYTIKSLHVTKHNLRLLSVGPQNTVSWTTEHCQLDHRTLSVGPQNTVIWTIEHCRLDHRTLSVGPQGTVSWTTEHC